MGQSRPCRAMRQCYTHPWCGRLVVFRVRFRVAAGVAVTVAAISGMVMVARLKKRREVILADMTKPLVGAEEGRLQLYT